MSITTTKMRDNINLFLENHHQYPTTHQINLINNFKLSYQNNTDKKIYKNYQNHLLTTKSIKISPQLSSFFDLKYTIDKKCQILYIYLFFLVILLLNFILAMLFLVTHLFFICYYPALIQFLLLFVLLFFKIYLFTVFCWLLLVIINR